MKDLGEKVGGPFPETKTEKTKWYPSVTVDAKDFPGLMGEMCEMNKDVKALLKVRKTGERMNTSSDGKKTHKIELELRGMEIPKKSEPKSIEDARREMLAEEAEKE